MSTNQYDAVVVGGGHNGLINGAYLAKAGLKTLVLEKNPIVGGAAITEELLPGFKFTTFSYAISLLRPDIIQDLQLTKHGLMVLPLEHTFQPGFGGDYLFLGPDCDTNYHELARYSPADAEAYRNLNHLIHRACDALQPIMDQIPPNLTSDDPEDQAAVRALENHVQQLDPDVRAMVERFASCSALEILDDYFETDLIKAMYASSGIIGSHFSPSSKESGLVWLVHKMGEVDGAMGEWGFHRGGNGEFTQVLARAFVAVGGTIRENAPVERVVYDNERASGVILTDGTEILADIVVSALDPKWTFQRLVEPADLPDELNAGVSQFQYRGVASKVNFALDELPNFPGLEGRRDIYSGFVNIGPSIEYLERAYEDCQAGHMSKRPFIDCCVQSVVDPTMSPVGKHVMSCFVMYTPYQLVDGDWEQKQKRDELASNVVSTLDEFFPGFSDQILHHEVVTPVDIENRCGLSEGNIFGGEIRTSQMFVNRPVPGWNQYRTPIRGYYQCGSGTHPGGCVCGGPGKLAARQILRDRTAQQA